MDRFSIDRWLAPLLPPPGALDADASQRARFLAIGGLLAGIATLSLLPQLAGRDVPAHLWVVVGIGLVGAALTLALVRTGRIAAAGHAFPAIAIGIGALMEIAEGGTSARTNVLIVGVIMAGLLVRPRFALFYTGLAAGVIALAHAAAASGWITPAPPLAADAWLTSVRMVVLSGLLVTLLAGALRRTIDRLRERERELSESLAALERARAAEDEAHARLRQAEKLESLGRLAGGIAHDFNNLLTVILGNASLALEGSGDRPLLEQIATAADRGAQLTRQLLAFSRHQPLPPRPIDIHQAIDDLRPLLERLLGERITIRTRFEATDATLTGDPGRVDQILVNLAVNGQEAMPDGGTLRFETTDAQEPGRFRLTIGDTGVGISPELREKIFEPFFSTRAAGTGLGLATVKAAVAELGGTIGVESVTGRGTSFVLELPCARADAAETGAPPAHPPPRDGCAVLLVDDDPTVRETVRQSLDRLGYEVLTTAGVAEAVAALRGRSGGVALCVTDVVLAQGSGPSVAAAVREVQPDCPVLYMSGYTAGELERHGIETESGFLAKPFTPAQLGRAVADLIGLPEGGAALEV